MRNMRKLLFTLATGTFAGLAAAQSYDISFAGARIDNTRSRHEDTVYASITIKVGDTPFPSQTKFLGNHNNGAFPVGLTFSAIQIPSDNTSVTVVWSMINNGHGDTGAIQNALASATDGYLRGSGQ